jgi:hypothetical protein
VATSIMTVGPNQPIFGLRLKGDDLDDQLAFIVLVSLRFDGEITRVGPQYISGDNKRFGDITVRFPTYEKWDGARAQLWRSSRCQRGSKC